MKRRSAQEVFDSNVPGMVELYLGGRMGAARLLYEPEEKQSGERALIGYLYRQPQTSLMVDVGVVGVRDNRKFVLLIQRTSPPYSQAWAFPGGYVDIANKEPVEHAAKRELKEETGIDVKQSALELVTVKSDPDRDPRGHTTTYLFKTVVNLDDVQPHAGSDAGEVRWVELDEDNFTQVPRSRGLAGAAGGPQSVIPAGEVHIDDAKSLGGAKIDLAFDHADLIKRLIDRRES